MIGGDEPRQDGTATGDPGTTDQHSDSQRAVPSRSHVDGHLAWQPYSVSWPHDSRNFCRYRYRLTFPRV